MKLKGPIRTAAVLLFFSFGFFWRCANIGGTIEGGDRDTIPPTLMRSTPENGSTNIFPKSIFIQFDELVQLQNVQAEIFTSPFMEKKPRVAPKRRGIEVTMESELDSNTTYVINFGGSVADNNEKNPFIGLEYVFSTGDAIDSIYASGYMYDAGNLDSLGGAFVLFFDPADDPGLEYDSTIFNAMPLAVGRSRPNGIFIHSNLKPMEYRIYGLVDNNNDQKYDPGSDAVAFLDKPVNPVDLPSFHMWFDSTVMYYVAEPQLMLPAFMEQTPNTRQNLSTSTRTEANKIVLSFAAPHPEIESFSLRGIDRDSIVVEHIVPTLDSTIYWLKGIPENMPDTLMGSITYMKPDSLGVFVPTVQELVLAVKKPELTRQEQKALEEEEALADGKPKKKNWFQRWKERRRQRRIAWALNVLGKLEDKKAEFAVDSTGAVVTDSVSIAEVRAAEEADTTTVVSTVRTTLSAGSPVTPDSEKSIEFNLPTERFEMERVVMTRTDIRKNSTEIPVTLTRDTLHIRQFHISGVTFTEGEGYQLMIPAGAVTTIDGAVNDTIRHSITVDERSKFAIVKVNLTGGNPDHDYIVQIRDAKGTSVGQEFAGLNDGAHELTYITVGKVSISVVEDRNRNGKWDTGNLVRRLQPEKTAFYIDPATALREITTSVSIDRELDIDLSQMFGEYELKSVFDQYHTHDGEGHPDGDEHDHESEEHDHENE